MITGSVATALYGEPRFTYDVDLVVIMERADIAKLVAAYPETEYYVPPVESLEEEVARPRQGQFNIIHHDSALKGDFYVVGDDPLHAWAMERRARQDLEGEVLWVAPIEYVILRKLEWYRDGSSSKHLDDIRAMLRVSGDRVDGAELQRWISRLGLDVEWRRVAIGPGGR